MPYLWPLIVDALVLSLHLLLPARAVVGYVKDARGERLRYRLNGLRVDLVVVALFCTACATGLLPWDVFYQARWPMLIGACVLGLVFTCAVVLPAPARSDLMADLYLGRRDNPQWRGLDAKMYLYLVGAVQLELNVISFTAHHVLAFAADPSPGIVLYAAMLTFFLTEYLYFEEVHLYTYDFMAERVGFKLGWGCLVFYPFFYCVGLWSEADQSNPHTPWPLLVLCALVFFAGWVLARGANLQKYHFKRDPQAAPFGLLPVAIADGERAVLASGFWGLSRHINYLGEILMATGLTLSLGRPGSLWPWLYPLYYIALLVPRQRDDDRRCAQKYGALWTEYCRRVPYRIIPGIY